ncbi:HEAT repeat domain-containing protein [Tessaracoccus sp. SD287]|uniref:HEAT repeat domain-containing protein n=1 Tax=Tessaracoccus sp. SD287 TaxID=2782008 RepID=UPI001A958D38|nr:HEAT repeat domain-containing protein [Tessaracoccus sp. SD287]
MDDQWLKIGDLVRLTGLTSRTLRHYDHLGLLVPSGRTGGDVRMYGADDVRRLLAIQQLKSLGLSLQDIASALDDASFDAGTALEDHIAVVEARIAAERELLTRLRRLRGAAATGWQEVVDVIALTERLRHPDPAIRFRTTLQSPRELPLEELLDLLRADPVPGVREVATWAIAQHGPAAVDAVVAQLDDPDPSVRLQMAHVASKLNDPAAAPGLVRLLQDTEPRVRAKAAFALGRLARPETITPLVAALADPDDTVADAVVGALGHFAGEARPALVEAIGAASATVRERAADVLGRQGLATSVPLLAAALDDAAAPVRLTALLALSSIHDDQARSAVSAARSHADPQVSAVAARLS